MVCKVCNQEVEVGLKVCPFCGASMEVSDAGVIDIQFTEKKAASIDDKKAPAPKKTKKGISKKNLIDEAPIKIVDDSYEENENSEPEGPIELDFFEPEDDCPTPITVIDNEDEIETIRPLFAKERTKPKKVKGLEREKQPQKPQPKAEAPKETQKEESSEPITEPIVFDTAKKEPPVKEEPAKEPILENAVEEIAEEPANEPVEEIADEAVEEPVEETVEETPKEPVEEAPAEETADEVLTEEAAEDEAATKEPSLEAKENEPEQQKEEEPFLPEEIVEEYIAPVTEKAAVAAPVEAEEKLTEEATEERAVAPLVLPEEIVEDYIAPQAEETVEEAVAEEPTEETVDEIPVEEALVEEPTEEPASEETAEEEELVVPELVPADMQEPEREAMYEYPPSVVLYEKVSKCKARREEKPVKDRVNLFIALLSMMFPPYLGAFIWITRSARKPKAANTYGLLTIFSYLFHRFMKNVLAVVSLLAIIIGSLIFAYYYVGNALFEAGYLLTINFPWM